MLRIGQFTDTFLPVVDGVGRVVQAYAETLSAMGHQVTVVAPMYDTGTRGGFSFELVDFIATSIPGMKQYKLGEAMLDAHYRRRIRMVELTSFTRTAPLPPGPRHCGWPRCGSCRWWGRSIPNTTTIS